METGDKGCGYWPLSMNGTKNNAKEIVLITWRRGYDNNAVSVRLRFYANPQNFHQFSQMTFSRLDGHPCMTTNCAPTLIENARGQSTWHRPRRSLPQTHSSRLHRPH